MRKRSVTRNPFFSAMSLLISLLLIACASGGFSGMRSDQNANNDSYELRSTAAIAAEIASYSAPTDLNTDVFATLKSALASAVLSNPVTRKVGAVPQGDSGLVTDLSFNQGTGETTWTYKNVGDYDLSGEVGVPDITPIAQNYLALATPGSLLGWIDGDDSGEVGISDITPIANNYLNAVIGYRILTSSTSTGTYNEIARVTLEDAKDALPIGQDFPITFTIPISVMMQNWIAVQPYDGSDNFGERSEPVELVTGEVPPNVTNVSPQGGVEGSIVTFNATVSGSPPMTYNWNFGGGATPNTSINAAPQVTLGADGSYNASVSVTNDFGSDTYDFTLIVSQQGLETPAMASDVVPIEGTEGETQTFNATVSGTEPITFSWNFGGGAAPNTTTDRSPEVVLGAPGAYNASVTVDNAFGPSNTFDFTLTVNPAVAIDPVIDGDNWSSYILDTSNENYAKYTAVALIDGKPAILYTRDDRKWIKYAYSTVVKPTSPADWVTSSVNETGNRGGRLGLIEVQGVPCIVYVATLDQDVYFGFANSATPSDPADWNIHENDALSMGEPQIAAVGDSPVLVYRTASGVRFAQGISSPGLPVSDADWANVDIDTGVQYAYPSITTVGGFPAIAYQRKSGGWNELWYAYSSSTTPQTPADWTKIKVDDSMKNTGLSVTVAEQGGLPIIAYQNVDDTQFNEFLCVARASSATPTSGNWTKMAIMKVYQTHYGRNLGVAIVGGRTFISSNYTIGTGYGRLLACYPTVDNPATTDDWQAGDIEVASDYFINEQTSPLTLADGSVMVVFRSSLGMKVAYYTAP